MGRPIQPHRGLRRVRAGALTLLALAAGGCAEPLLFDNVVPVVTGLGPVVPDGEGRARVSLWVQDWDGDPVDVALVYEVQGQGEKALVPAPGGHGDVGLSSDPEWPGREHVFLWDLTDVPAGAQLRLRATPDDRLAGTGDTLETPAFDIAVGFDQTVVP